MNKERARIRQTWGQPEYGHARELSKMLRGVEPCARGVCDSYCDPYVPLSAEPPHRMARPRNPGSPSADTASSTPMTKSTAGNMVPDLDELKETAGPVPAPASSQSGSVLPAPRLHFPWVQFVVIAVVSNNVILNVVNIGDSKNTNKATVHHARWLVPGRGQGALTPIILRDSLASLSGKYEQMRRWLGEWEPDIRGSRCVSVPGLHFLNQIPVGALVGQAQPPGAQRTPSKGGTWHPTNLPCPRGRWGARAATYPGSSSSGRAGPAAGWGPGPRPPCPGRSPRPSGTSWRSLCGSERRSPGPCTRPSYSAGTRTGSGSGSGRS